MAIKFYKYQGTGNDFILIEDWDKSKEQLLKNRVEELCDRKFGIGADGLIFIQACEGYDFFMKYYNSDGQVSTMCGNGGRCIISLINKLGKVEGRMNFLAADGPHQGYIDHDVVYLQMTNVDHFRKIGMDYFIDTGSPHFIRFIDDFTNVNVNKEGRKIRFSEEFKSVGVNVNFVEINPDFIKVATYERGVEGETLSCGTGVTAAALISKIEKPDQFNNSIRVRTKGGKLEVKFKYDGNSFSEVWLCGSAVNTFEGTIKN